MSWGDEQHAVLETLHPGLQRLVKEMGWGQFSPVQHEAIPVILSKCHCVVEAPTAGGKTEAVLFPTLTRAATTTGKSVRILYLAPLRALLNDLEPRARRYAQACGLHAFKWHGDVTQAEKLEALRQPPALLLSTPESIEAILLRKEGWPELFRNLQAVIVDEAHSFALGDRGGHVASLLERLENGIGAAFQRIAITATVANIEDMGNWLVGYGRDTARTVRVGGAPPERNIEVRLFVDESDEEEGKCESASVEMFTTLQGVIAGNKSIVFVRSRAAAESIAKAFVEARRGRIGPLLNVRTHHSAVSKYFREEAERLIRVSYEGGIDAIISTSTLELGIDIGELDRVVQIGCLSSPSGFVQRLGRTGRRPGHPQHFRGYCLDSEDMLVLAATVQLGMRGLLERVPFPKRAFHLLAHQVLCLCLQNHGVDQQSAWRILSRVACFGGVREEEFNRLIEFMVEKQYLACDGSAIIVGGKAEERFLQSNWRPLFAVFDTAPLYEVRHKANHVGTLDAAFVETLKLPFFFVLAGRPWKAVNVVRRSRVVQAEESHDATSPKWMSFGGPDIPWETAQGVGELLRTTAIPSFLDESAARALAEDRVAIQDLAWTPNEVVVHEVDGETHIETFAGERINRTLARLVEVNDHRTAVSDYRRVRVRKASVHAMKVHLRELRSICSDHVSIENLLARGSRPFPFSPFAECLPKDLWAAAFLEQRMDIQGLRRLLDTCTVRIAS